MNKAWLVGVLAVFLLISNLQGALALSTTGLIGEYSMNTDMRNDFNGLYNGSTTGSPTHSATGGVGNSGYFTDTFSSSKYMSIAHNAAFDIDDGDFTISIWADTDTATGLWVNKFTGDFTTTGTPTGWYMRESSANWDFTEYQTGAIFTTMLNASSISGWTKITWVVQDAGANWSMYYNDTLVSTATKTDVQFDNNDGIYFGVWRWNGGNAYSGGLDQFTIWTRALTDAEVAEMYECELNNTRLQSCGILTPNRITLTLNDNVTGDSIGSNVKFSNVTGDLTFNYFNITSSGFCVTYTGNGTGTNCTSSGSGSSTYFNVSKTETISGDTNVNTNTYQSRIGLQAYRLFLNTSITTFNVTNDQAFNSSTVNNITYIKAINGSNNLQADVPGNYSKNATCTVSSPLTTIMCNVTGVYDHQLTMAAQNGSAALTNYTTVIYNDILGGTLINNFSTTHANIFNLLQGYTYQVNTSKTGYVSNDTTITPSTASQTYNATLVPITIDITFRDEENRTLLPGINITLIIIESDGTQNVYYTNTSTFSISGEFPPGSYTLRYGATGYSLRDYYFNLTAANANLTLYLIIDSVYSAGVVEVRNYDGLPVNNAIVKLKRFYGDPTVPNEVQMATTNSDGEAVMTAEVVTSFYLWEVVVDGETRVNTTIPELLVLESDGLWRKTFVLGKSGRDARGENTGFNTQFRPSGTLTNNTRYEFTFNYTSSYWNVTACTFQILDATNLTILNQTSTPCAASGQNMSVYYTPVDDVLVRSTLTTAYFTNTYESYHQVYPLNASGFTLKDLADDITNFDGSGFGGFSRFILAVIIITGLVLGLATRTDLIASSEEILFLIFTLSLLFSYINWLYLPIDTIPFEAAKQWLLSIILGLIAFIGYYRKEGATT